ncbi:ABC transporter ATP-binding protein/permease [Flavobacteriaceae bacterium]|nr:ABC transporter ATP-binding protein/permease [Flavobacteriaceae bacterium]
MKFLKIYFKKYLNNLIWFYGYLRYKIFIATFLSIIVGLLDGIGISMFLPLLKIVSGNDLNNSNGLEEFSFILDFISNSGIKLSLSTILIVMILFFVLKGFTKFVGEIYRVVLQQRLIRILRINLLTSLNKVRYKSFATSNFGQIQNSLTGEVDRVQQAYIYYFQTFEEIILISVYMSFAFFIDYKFASLISFAGFLTNVFYKKIFQSTTKFSQKLTYYNNFYQGQIIQYLGNYKYLRATGLLNKFSDKITITINNLEINRKKIGFLSGFMLSVREPVLIIIVATVIYIQINVLQGSLGTILISLLFFYRALSSLAQLQNVWNLFLGLSGSIDNLKSIQAELNLKKQKDFEGCSLKFNNYIELRNVNLNYGDLKILKDINLKIQKNKITAFIGESGSGKTSLINLISGLIPCDEGQVLIDNKSIEGLNIESFQKRIGYITQEPVIFNDTIFNNVTLWADKSEQNLNRFYSVIEKTNMSNEIQKMNLKEQTLLGNNGINLSGGQKQRISIARELFKQIDILIMDEATSALDSEVESTIQENINKLKDNITILIVAHRLSTIKNADKIILMNNGKIVESGKFKELYKNSIDFKRALDKQQISI